MIRPAISRLPILVTLLAASSFGASAQTQSDVASPSSRQATTQSPAKVWTNDNIASAGEAIDSSPTARSKTISASRPKPVAMKGRNAKWYADQIGVLQARIPPLDTQIAQLQSALDGKAAGDGKTSQRPRFAKIDQWPIELKNLQARRQTILDKIDALRDEARHNGVPPSALPYPLAQ